MLHARSSRRSNVAALTTLLLGLAASAALFAWVFHLENEKLELDFRQRAHVRFITIRSGLDSAIEALRTVNRLFATIEPVSREQFHRYVNPLLERYPYIQAFNFHRIVRAEDAPGWLRSVRAEYPGLRITQMIDGHIVPAVPRPWYDIVDFLEPLKGNEAALGLDVSPNVDMMEVTERARDAGLPVATHLLTLAQGRGKGTGFVVVMPVFRHGMATDSVAARRNAFVGDTAAVFLARDLIEKILAGAALLDVPGFDIDVYAGANTDAVSHVFHNGAVPTGTHLAPYSDVVDVAGQSWQVVISPSAMPWLPNHVGSLFACTGGLLFTLLASAYVHALWSRTRRIQQLVDERTSELSHSRAEVEHQAQHDALTGLANRTLLRVQLRAALADAARHGSVVWVAFLDLDRFKDINDSVGHQTGDQLLVVIAQRLQAALRPPDSVARAGGDEFVLILPMPADGATRHNEDVVRTVMRTVAEPIHLNGQEFFPACSMGISVFPGDSSDPDDAEILLSRADIAMYRAKDLGRDNYQFFTEAMNARLLHRLRIEKDLRNALERGQMQLHYQPQVDLQSGRMVGAEALLRWNHPEMGMIPPDRFIGLAEDTGLILPIGDWVIREACRQSRAWRDAGLDAMQISVNLSPRQFAQPGLVDSIAAILAQYGLVGADLDVELTEGLVMADVAYAIATLREIKALGIRISIDDFGTGYSSLAYLTRFPIDILKVDRSFVNDLTSDPSAAAIVASIIALAHSLNLSVIAEGVETREQLAYLRLHRCDAMQGYLFSKPLPALAMEDLMRRHRTLASLPAGKTSDLLSNPAGG